MSEQNSNDRAVYRYLFGDTVFDEGAMSLTVRSQPVELERRPLELLCVLLAHSDEAMTKEELLEAVWVGQTTVENVLANAVAKLRKALGPDAGRIETLPRIGYRFVGPVERVASGRKLVSELSLKTGESVPMRPRFVLRQLLSSRSDREVWRAENSKTGECRIFKFAATSLALAGLKREVTLFRFLTNEFADRAPIVRVLDWNFEAPPFFIESEDGGENLKDWYSEICLEDPPSKETRLDIAVTLALSVAVLHNAGVLHKDLKPTNVLMSRAGNTWAERLRLVDFGSGDVILADRLEEVGITPLGWTMSGAEEALNSTPIYTAPEVYGTRSYSAKSDIYALGVMIYQILTGNLTRPMAPGWESEIDDPLLIEDIALATHGDPDHRIGSASELAQRLQTLEARRQEQQAQSDMRAREAVLAKKMEQARTRRPWIVAAGGALIAGLLASLWFNTQANAARLEAERRATQAETTRDFLVESLVYVAPGMRGTDDHDHTVWKEALEKAEVHLLDVEGNDPETYAALSYIVGRIYGSANLGRDSLERYRASADAYEALEGPVSPRTIKSRLGQVHAHVVVGELVEARALLDTVKEDFARLRNPEFELYFDMKFTQGTLLAGVAEYEPAEALFRELVEAYETHPDQKRAALGYRDDFDNWSRAVLNLGQMQGFLGQHDAAANTLQPLLDMVETSPEDVPEYTKLHVYTIAMLTHLLSGDHEGSIRYARTGRDISIDLYSESNAFTLQFDYYLALAYTELGDYQKVLETTGPALEIGCADGPVSEPICGLLYDAEATALYLKGERIAAASRYAVLSESYAQSFGADSAQVMRTRYYIAMAAIDRSDFAEARALLDAVEFDAIHQVYPTSDWGIFGRAAEARYRYAATRSEDAETALRAVIEEMRTLGASEAVLAPFSAELDR